MAGGRLSVKRRALEIVRCYRIATSFFFQAEDGIRDLTVTGVQTCALPISLAPPSRNTAHTSVMPRTLLNHIARRMPRCMRSEERRQGKECRSRWQAYH